MTVYVDDAEIPSGRMVLCRMWGDDRSELLSMADRIGVARRAIQVVPGQPTHFLVCRAKRGAALHFGAVPTDAHGPAETLARADLASADPARVERGRAAMARIDAARRRAGKGGVAAAPVGDLFGGMR